MTGRENCLLFVWILLVSVVMREGAGWLALPFWEEAQIAAVVMGLLSTGPAFGLLQGWGQRSKTASGPPAGCN